MKPEVELVHCTPNAEFLLEKSIRVCYNSFDKCDGTLECAQKLIRKVISMWHVDTLEHATATFRISCSRVAMAQMTRHRHASFGVESQRYVKYDEPVFIRPAKYEDGYEFYDEVMKIEHEAYEKLITDYGWNKEDARYVLGDGWRTNLYVTMNFRAWRHFIDLRADKSAQDEIRTIAKLILVELHRKAPSVFDDMIVKFMKVEENAKNDESKRDSQSI